MAKEPKKPSGAAMRNKTRQLEATAKAKEAEARTREIEARLETSRIEAEAKRRADEAAARSQKQVFDTGVTLGTYAAGLAGGKMLASSLDKKVAASVAVKNVALKDLAGTTGKLIEKAGGDTAAGKRATAKLNATVKVADRAKLTRVGRGPAGLVTAAGLVALGMTTRSFAAGQEDETMKTVLNAAGTAEVVAGGAVLYSDLAARAAPKALPDVKSLATIEQARAIGKPGTPAVPVPDKAAPAAAKTKPRAPAQSGAKKAKTASKAMITGMSKVTAAAETGGAVAKVASKAAVAGRLAARALPGLGMVLMAAGAAYSAYDSIQRGDSAGGVMKSAALGALGLDMGTATAAETPKETAKTESGSPASSSNHVSSEALAAFNGVVGVGATVVGAVVRSRALKFAGVANLALASMHAKTVGESSGKAYLNDAAQKKAETAPAISPAAAGAMAAQAMVRGDGQTESYTRRTRDGKAVTVTGYRTPTR